MAENIANADTPGYQARDLTPLSFERMLQSSSVAWSQTEPAHLGGAGGDGRFAAKADHRFEVRPRGNAVTHEEEMLKLAGNQADYDAVTSIYTHSLTLIKTAVGRA